MATITLNISEPEMAVVEQLAKEHDMSKTAVLRQAIRFYQMLHERLKAGETFQFSGDRQRTLEFIGVGLGQDLSGGSHD